MSAPTIHYSEWVHVSWNMRGANADRRRASDACASRMVIGGVIA